MNHPPIPHHHNLNEDTVIRAMNNQQRYLQHMSFGSDLQPLNASEIFGSSSAAAHHQFSDHKASPRFTVPSGVEGGAGGDLCSSSFINNNNSLVSNYGQFNPRPLPDFSLPEDKRKFFQQEDDFGPPSSPTACKKQRLTPDAGTAPIAPTTSVNFELKLDPSDQSSAPSPVAACKQGQIDFEDNDVLSGRGGGTNVHPGNRNFRDLINLHRRAYLKARKNDKPAISKAIVRAIRESGGKFLKKNNRDNLWYEIGDSAAREKTSQALRQRAPEMRKLLFDAEREEARAAQGQLLHHQRMLSSSTALNAGAGEAGAATPALNVFALDESNRNSSAAMMAMSAMGMNTGGIIVNPSLLQAMQVAHQKQQLQQQHVQVSRPEGGAPSVPVHSELQNMFPAAFLGGDMGRFGPSSEV